MHHQEFIAMYSPEATELRGESSRELAVVQEGFAGTLTSEF
jgi:hypothetical protein